MQTDFRPKIPLSASGGEGLGERWPKLVFRAPRFILHPVNPSRIARRLRRDQPDEEKQLWRKLRADRFAGFKFRRQHPAGIYFLDFYCPPARLSIDLDGFQHGLPQQMERDKTREEFLASEDIVELRFWNHQWRNNPEGVLLEIWHALHQQTGCVKVLRKEQNHRFRPPDPARLTKAHSETPLPTP